MSKLRPCLKIAFIMLLFGRVCFDRKSSLNFDPDCGIFVQKLDIFWRCSSEKMKLCGNYYVNFKPKSFKKKLIFSELKPVFRLDLPLKNWCWLKYTGIYSQIMWKCTLKCLFFCSFNSRIKNFGDVWRLFELFKAGLPKTKSKGKLNLKSKH